MRRFLKTAIGFLIGGLLLGGWMMIRRELAGSFPSQYLVSAHTHAILIGFVMMMILGVALWMFPRPAKDDARYDVRLVNIAYWCLTIGTAARVSGELLRTFHDQQWLRWAVVASGTAQIGGIALFFYTMWSRIRGVGSGIREQRGEQF
ncbi:MAG: cbb3-type cytochrome c oxidase subunit I [Gemmatimonadaceae bacterium]